MHEGLTRVKTGVRTGMRAVAAELNTVTHGRLTPNMVTWFGFAMHVPIALLIAEGQLLWAGLYLIVFGLFDTLDGELARLQERTSDKGGLLDAATDRFKEVLLYSGAAYYFTSGPHPAYAVLAVTACGASLSVSYVKAKGEAVVAASHTEIPYPELNHMFADGLFTFEVRMAVLVIGLLTSWLALAVTLIALCSIYTAFQRLFAISRRL